MAFYGYEGDVDERYWTPHGGEFDHSSPFDLGEPNPINYYKDDYSEPINYTYSYNYCEYSVNQSETSYSEPKYLQYDPPPPPHYQVYFPSQTKFTVSYSNAELIEPLFEEYDPTPYDGGYDQTMTYGKPVPPSDLTCYPRSLPQSDAPPLDNFSFDSIPSPYGRDEDIPPSGSKPTDIKTETGSLSNVEDGGKVKAVDLDAIPSGGYSTYEHQNGLMPQIPYGSGLEAMDICESLFGYWPCVAAKKAQEQRKHCQVCDQDRRIDPWKTAADYLFGGPLPYDYNNYHQISWLQ